jgi:hypothetical protein
MFVQKITKIDSDNYKKIGNILRTLKGGHA